MKTNPYIYSQPNYLLRTAIEAVHAVRQSRTSNPILFAVCIIKCGFWSGSLNAYVKTPPEKDPSSKKIGAVLVQQADRCSFEASAVFNFVFFVMLKNKIEQSAVQRCLRPFELRVLPFGKTSGIVFLKSYFNDDDIWEFYEIAVPARISNNVDNKFHWHIIFLASKNYEKCIVFFNSKSQHNLVSKLTPDEFHIISKQINLRLISNNSHKKYSNIRGINQQFYLRICNKKHANVVYGDTANAETYMWAKQLYYYFNQFVLQKDRHFYRIEEEKTFEENMFEVCGIKFSRL